MNFVSENLTLAQRCQKHNYDKNHREVCFEEKARVWLQPKAEKSFTANPAPKWQGLYHVLQQVGPLNYDMVLEESGEDRWTVHVSCFKPCFPTAQQLEEQ